MYQPKCEFYLFDKFVPFLCSTWESKKDIVVTTYRERVSAEITVRAFYKKIGFSEGKRPKT